ncbi:MAG: class I adenylate-forming enzyme family protein [Rhizobiaceae bacterium]
MIDWTGPELPATRQELHYGDRMVACFVDRPADLWAMVEAAGAFNANGEALVCGDNRWTWRALLDEVGRTAAGLARQGVAAGDRVAILLGNRAEFVVALYACFRIGAIVVPLSVRYQTPEIAYAVNDCGAILLLHDAELAPRLPPTADVPALKQRIAVGGDAEGSSSWSSLIADTALPPLPAVNEDATAVILYTSGTTGLPKGAMLSHLGLVNSSLVFRHCFELTPADRSIAAVPLAHVTGLVANVLSMAACAGTLVVLPAFKAPAFLALAAAERTTHTIIVPAMYSLLLMATDFDAHDLSAWRIGGFGGAPMPEPVIEAFARKLPGLSLMNAYGATETSSPSTIMPARHTAAHLASVGLPVPNCTIVVVDETGRQVTTGEAGELWIAGPSVVKGYWNRPDATADSFAAGYWRSGDIGSVDADGFVHVFDRKKDMIIRGGLKIFSAEVESVLAGHPDVVESAVLGKPCPVLGERVHAFVVLKQGVSSADGLRAYLAGRLSDYKVPETITISATALPRNSNGKVLKRELRDALLASSP